MSHCQSSKIPLELCTDEKGFRKLVMVCIGTYIGHHTLAKKKTSPRSAAPLQAIIISTTRRVVHPPSTQSLICMQAWLLTLGIGSWAVAGPEADQGEARSLHHRLCKRTEVDALGLASVRYSRYCALSPSRLVCYFLLGDFIEGSLDVLWLTAFRVRSMVISNLQRTIIPSIIKLSNSYLLTLFFAPRKL